MMESKNQRGYTSFAELHNKSDDKILAFIKKNGPLGLNPRKGNYIGGNRISWDYAGSFIDYDRGKRFFIPWESAPPVPERKVSNIEETPDIVRREAKKVYLVIQLWQIAYECTDKGGKLNNELFFNRRFEINHLTSELEELWPTIPIMYPTYPPPGRTTPMGFDRNVGETRISIPHFEYLFDNILLRIRFKIARDKDIYGKSPFMFNLQNGHLEIKESCLLAKLWFEMISDMVEGKAPPRICPHCNQLFIPARPNQRYHPSCQIAANQHKQRIKRARKEGRRLRASPGRPPGVKAVQVNNTSSTKEVQP